MENFIVPNELNYSLTQSDDEVNKILEGWEAINYVNHYRDNAQEIINNRFKCSNYDHIPGMNLIFETMIDKLKVSNPMDEMQKLIDEDEKIIIPDNIINGTNTNLLKQ